MKTRGHWFDYDTGTRMIRALATFHPAYLLRSPSYKRMAWQDLRAIAKALEETKVVVLRRVHRAASRRMRRDACLQSFETPLCRAPRDEAHVRDDRYGTFGRTMAQPIRSSGWRPFTSRSKARGTSGTRPGNRLRDIGRRRADGIGGAPDHDAAGFVEFRQRQPRRPLRRRRRETDAAARRPARSGSPAARRRPPPAAADWCAAQNCRRRNARSRSPAARSRTSAPPVQGRKSVVTIAASAGATTAAAQTVRSTRWRRS